MAIKLTNANSIPALTYDQIHIDHFSLMQKREANPLDTKRKLDIIGVPYGQDLAGLKYYETTNPISASTENFDELAVGEYLALNPGATLQDAMVHYATQRAAVQAEYDLGNLDTMKLMAYLEMAIAKALILMEAAEVAGIE